MVSATIFFKGGERSENVNLLGAEFHSGVPLQRYLYTPELIEFDHLEERYILVTYEIHEYIQKICTCMSRSQKLFSARTVVHGRRTGY